MPSSITVPTDVCTAPDYYLRPSVREILRQLTEEMVAVALSSSLTAVLLAWGRRQGRAIAKRMSSLFHDDIGDGDDDFV